MPTLEFELTGVQRGLVRDRMLLIVIEGGKEEVYELPQEASILDLLTQSDRYPDSYIAMKDSLPVPITLKLHDGETIRLVNVASRG